MAGEGAVDRRKFADRRYIIAAKNSSRFETEEMPTICCS
jgi:hypothetical protein